MKLIEYLDSRGIQYEADGDGVRVEGALNLSHSAVTKLPDNLSVGGYLNLIGAAITKLPDNLSVGGSLYLDPERISNVVYRENCGEEERTIFATWTNGEFRIAAGCFFDTIDVFESAVDEKYSGRAAEAYKQAARDCVAELREKLGITGGISEH